MVIDEKKLERQKGQVQRWISEGAQASLAAVTGYGKTYVAILAIQRLHTKYPKERVDVVVPTLTLKDDWTNSLTGHIHKHKLQNIEVFVVNTYCKFGRRQVGLLVLDEIHRYASEEFIKVFEAAGCKKKIERVQSDPYILGLSATMERLDGKHTLLEEYCPVFDTVTMEEARREGYISNYKAYNLGLELSKEDREEYEKWHNIFNNSFGKFSHNFDLAMACAKGKDVKSEVNGQWATTREWQQWWSREQGYELGGDDFWSPQKIATYAQQFVSAMRNRKTFIYRASVKREATRELVAKFPVKTMVFSEDCEFADKVTEDLGEICKSYHNKISGYITRIESISAKGQISYKNKRVSAAHAKKDIIISFKSSDGIRVISTVRTLNEGFDYAGVRLSIKASYNSSKTARIQRDGRPTRTDYDDLDKTAIIVNLYIIDSQEEKWLRENQRGQKGILWVTSIDQITANTDLFDKEHDTSS